MSERIETGAAPRAIGPYSQGVVAGSWVFTAGQIGLDPVSGELAEGLEPQSRQALANIGGILAAAGCSWRDVVRTTVFLADLADFTGFNAIYAAVVLEPFPARSTVQAAGLPRGALVEVDAIALKPDVGA